MTFRETYPSCSSDDSPVGLAGSPDGSAKLDQTAAAFRAFLESLGLDLRDPNLEGTDRRVARAYQELLRGLQPDAEPMLSSFPNDGGHRGIVVVAHIPFYAICAHHFLPFFGTVNVGYVPGARLLGLSKFARVVDFYARRPQLQERMTEQIASHLDERLSPAGVIVSVEGRHMCMEMRGISAPGVLTSTLATRGTLNDPALQQQFMSRITGTHSPHGARRHHHA